MVHASQVALVVKNPPASAGDIKAWVGSLGQEEPLEKGMAGYSSQSRKESDTTGGT